MADESVNNQKSLTTRLTKLTANQKYLRGLLSNVTDLDDQSICVRKDTKTKKRIVINVGNDF